jgi:hypothetical protein
MAVARGRPARVGAAHRIGECGGAAIEAVGARRDAALAATGRCLAGHPDLRLTAPATTGHQQQDRQRHPTPSRTQTNTPRCPIDLGRWSHRDPPSLRWHDTSGKGLLQSPRPVLRQNSACRARTPSSVGDPEGAHWCAWRIVPRGRGESRKGRGSPESVRCDRGRLGEERHGGTHSPVLSMPQQVMRPSVRIPHRQPLCDADRLRKVPGGGVYQSG